MRHFCFASPAKALLAVLLGVCGAFSTASLAGQPGVNSTPDGKSHPLVLQLHWYPQAQFAGYMVAQDMGFFRARGADVRLRWTAAGEQPLEGLVAGQCDFCTGWLSDAMRQRDAGKPLVCIAQVFQRSSTTLVAWSNSGIVKPKDMDGKRVGLWGGNNDVQALAFFRQQGVQPVIVPQSASMVPFLRGAVDVASAMHYNEYHKLIEAGVLPEQLRTFSFADHGMAFPEDGIYCAEATRRDRARACEAVTAACREGWDYALDHEAETLDIVMNYCREANVRTNRNHQRWMLRSVATAICGQPGTTPAPWGSLSPGVYHSVAQELLEQKLLRAAPPFDQFFRPSTRQGQ
jgi:NitT/TauT family transport system substrate-binding protein